MAVRAKFTCQAKDEQNNIALYPAYAGGSEENAAFFQSTPAGSINLSIVNENAAQQFEIGKSYYIDFTPAD